MKYTEDLVRCAQQIGCLMPEAVELHDRITSSGGGTEHQLQQLRDVLENIQQELNRVDFVKVAISDQFNQISDAVTFGREPPAFLSR